MPPDQGEVVRDDGVAQLQPGDATVVRMEASSMDISVLGSVSVSRERHDVRLGPQVRRLFARLIVDCGGVVSANRLADAVGADAPPGRAQCSLKTYGSRLRQAIDPDRDGLISYREPRYVLAVSPDSLDCSRFEAELDDGAMALRIADPERAVEVLTSALARWHGTAYAEFANEEWARPEAVLGTGETDLAVAEAQALTRHQSLREHPRTLLMRSLYLTGRQPEVLREFAPSVGC